MDYSNYVQGHVKQTFHVGGKIGDNYKICLVSVASAHNDMGVQLDTDFRQNSSEL